MSQRLRIQQYQETIEAFLLGDIAAHKGELRNYFMELLEDLAATHHLALRSPEENQLGLSLEDEFGLKRGCWEHISPQIDLDLEIQRKLAENTPQDNLLFEDARTAVLIQAGEEVGRVEMSQAKDLERVLKDFLSYQTNQIQVFYQAMDGYWQKLPAYYQLLVEAFQNYKKKLPKKHPFRLAFEKWLLKLRKHLHPETKPEAAQAFLIQHLLTKELFLHFDPNQALISACPTFQEIERILQHWEATPEIELGLSEMRTLFTPVVATMQQLGHKEARWQFLKTFMHHFQQAYPPRQAGSLEIDSELLRFIGEAILNIFGDQNFPSTRLSILDTGASMGSHSATFLKKLTAKSAFSSTRVEFHSFTQDLLTHYQHYLVSTGHSSEQISLKNYWANAFTASQIDQTHQQAGLFTTPEAELMPTESAHCIWLDSPLSIKGSEQAMLANLHWAKQRLKEQGVVILMSSPSLLKEPAYEAVRRQLAQDFDEMYFLEIEGHISEKNKSTTKSILSRKDASLLSLLIKHKSPKDLAKVYSHQWEGLGRTEERKAVFRYEHWLQLPHQDVPLEDFYRARPRDEQDFMSLFPVAGNNLLENAETGLFKRVVDGIPKTKLPSLKNLSLARLQEQVRSLEKKKPKAKKSQPQLAFNLEINWAEEEDNLKKGENTSILPIMLSPWGTNYFYLATPHAIPRRYWRNLFQEKFANYYLIIPEPTHQRDFFVLASASPVTSHWGVKVKCLPLYTWDLQENKQINFREEAYLSFKAHYETKWQEQAEANLYHLRCLFNFSEFENCQVSPDLAHEIRQLTYLEEQGQDVSYLFKHINQPSEKLETILRKVFQIFIRVKKNFDRIGKKACQGQASYEVFQSYFEEGEQAIQALQTYLEQIDQQGWAEGLERNIDPEDVFFYTYALLQHPLYQKKYSHSLQHHFPRLPFLDNFWQWANWGKQLLEMHLHPEKLEPWTLTLQEEVLSQKARKTTLKLLPEQGAIRIREADHLYLIQDLPEEVWQYTINSKTALEWSLLNFIKNEWRIWEKKDEILEAIAQLTRMSVETCRVFREMEIAEPFQASN